MTTLTWTELDAKAVDTARILAADAVEKVGNGHPGTAISLAPLAYLLYQKVMHVDPSDSLWLGRDRFVLSAGHSSLTQYTQLFLGGYGLELEDIEALRTWGSLTPGHPEVHHTRGVECTTGPLGTGVANGVGFAMASRREHGLYDPTAAPGESIFDHFVYVIAGDGCMQEGVSGEASSLAATQELGNLILFYDDNRISIEGDTKIAFSEDVSARYAAYGWHVQHVDFTAGGAYTERVDELYAAIEAAKAVTDRPSFIKVTTVIGWPLPTKAGNHSVHGSKLGADEIAALKQELGFAPEPFAIDADLVATTRRNAAERGRALHEAWDVRYEQWRAANPEQVALLERVGRKELPAGFDAALPVFPAAKKKSTRSASGDVLSALAGVMPELWGGSADLAGSNNTSMKGQPSFLPADRGTKDFPADPYGGRTLHFGIREHAMGGILNAINLSGLTRAYGGTFLVFSDYMRPAPRLAALSQIPSTFVWTHDSIGVGEDGPTHQPVEHVASLRLIPGLDVIRPADANETAAAWAAILRGQRPAALILSRQDLTVFDRSTEGGFASVDGVTKGAYTLVEASTGSPTVVVVATGSEVEVAVAGRELLEADGIPTRVVSAPCLEWFAEQGPAYKEQLLPTGAVKVSIEAGVTYGWAEIVGSDGRRIGVDTFGASASASKLFAEYGITAEHVAEQAKAALI